MLLLLMAFSFNEKRTDWLIPRGGDIVPWYNIAQSLNYLDCRISA